MGDVTFTIVIFDSLYNASFCFSNMTIFPPFTRTLTIINDVMFILKIYFDLCRKYGRELPSYFCGKSFFLMSSGKVLSKFCRAYGLFSFYKISKSRGFPVRWNMRVPVYVNIGICSFPVNSCFNLFLLILVTRTSKTLNCCLIHGHMYLQASFHWFVQTRYQKQCSCDSCCLCVVFNTEFGKLMVCLFWFHF